MGITSTVLAFVAQVLSGATARWIDCQPSLTQRVYFANHTSHLDALVIWASLPAEMRALTRPVAARDYWEDGWLRQYLAAAFNAILIDRTEIKVHNSPIDVMLREMGTDFSAIVFPEGGRSEGDEVGEFKSGLYYIGKKRPEMELVPVYIDNMNRILPRGEFLPVPLLSCITFGAPIFRQPDERKFDFLRRAREALVRLQDM